MENKFFMHQIKRTGGTIDKGIAVKDMTPPEPEPEPEEQGEQ